MGGPHKARAARFTFFTRVLDALAPFLGLLLILVFFSSLHTTEGAPLREFFLTAGNFKFIAAQTVILAIGALGMTLIIVSGGIDLSAGSSIALSGVTAALALQQGQTQNAAILAAVLVGGLVGLVNGGLIVALRLPPFIVTLGMLAIVRGTAKWLAGGQPLRLPADAPINNLMAPFPAHSWMLVAPAVWITLVLAAVAVVIMRQTVFGRYVFAIGSNETAATLCGIRVRLTKILIYAAGGLFFGLAGLFQMARLRQGDPGTAAGLELDLIAAVVIGGTTLRGGYGSILGSVIGALMIAVLRNGSQQAGWPIHMQDIITGCVIIAAVALDRIRKED